MRKINFIDKRDYVLFLPIIYFRILQSYNKFNISRNDFIGGVLKSVYKSRFSNSYSVFLEYLKFYRKEFDTYRDFLDSYYNLTEFELNSLTSIFLRCSKAERLSPQYYLLYVKTIRDKLNTFFSGEFYIYEN